MELLTALDDDRIDSILRGIAGLFELTFPGRVSGYYLAGSYSEGAALPTSDIDLFVLFRGHLHDDEESIARRLVECCSLISPIELDIEPLGEPIPYPLRTVSLKLGSRLIFGEDTRDRIPLPSREAYARHAMDLAFRLLARLHGRDEPLPFPLDYPDPGGEFYGFVPPDGPAASGAASSGTKELVVAAGLAATAILAFRTGRYVSGKRDCIRQYEEAAPDQWGAFLAEICTCCRDRWEYRVPEAPQERRRLRELCEQALLFQNHFLGIHREYLQAEVERAKEVDQP